MRHNYPPRTIRNIEDRYDKIYECHPEAPQVRQINNHPRKLIIINIAADPLYSIVEDIWEEKTCFSPEEEDE